ncbi:NYN domain protein [Roseivivax jejudonensis]|uniref:NYN domain protein n=1 Tax=Roseivivax jejudonensis TaxID=1529041 RepID=A0A1X6ZWV5_9RHOB|nr:NYN domain-containing protein [Roseivivax jejudonensis]SLN64095.1 NYN domain protein [Roseivivax jejudonensis]
MAHEQNQTLALLIDGDNATPSIVDGLLAEIANYGIASVKRIYGDWTSPRLSTWKDCLLEHSIQPIQQFAYTSGKNATDGAMIIDAMDLLYTARFSAFCIVSSDSDFTRLASRVREQGVAVYGFGERKTPRAFIAACDKFVFFDVLMARDSGQLLSEQGVNDSRVSSPGQQAVKAASGGPALDIAAVDMLAQAIVATAEEDGRANLAGVGSHLAKQMPDFDARNFGFPRLTDLVQASGIAEVERGGQNPTIVRVRLRPDYKTSQRG